LSSLEENRIADNQGPVGSELHKIYEKIVNSLRMIISYYSNL